MEIPGYDAYGPLTHDPALLGSPMFWLGHLASLGQRETTAELLFGADFEAAAEFEQQMAERADLPFFTVPLAGGHRLHVVRRTNPDDYGTDYLLHHPAWNRALLIAADDGHFTGPGLSWPELVAAADSGLPGGSTADPHARLLLLLPAMGDVDLPASAVERLAAALGALTTVEGPHGVAVAFAEDQGPAGPARWHERDGVLVAEGAYSHRDPSNAFALPAPELARVSAALGHRR
ncbi:hypothetical protein [uncultured Streptomyces sp.]|uniref:hypothetical protein n=1 Tax=uncultured Streptomyces sp. TaxID=174707 RepID=UPI002611FDFB|nr:hypothetical protein [uncultured Streptomyces sp.]